MHYCSCLTPRLDCPVAGLVLLHVACNLLINSTIANKIADVTGNGAKATLLKKLCAQFSIAVEVWEVS